MKSNSILVKSRDLLKVAPANLLIRDLGIMFFILIVVLGIIIR